MAEAPEVLELRRDAKSLMMEIGMEIEASKEVIEILERVWREMSKFIEDRAPVEDLENSLIWIEGSAKMVIGIYKRIMSMAREFRETKIARGVR